MPNLVSLQEIVDFLFSLTASQVGIGLALCAATVAVAVDWRTSLFALAAQYVLVGVMLSRVILFEFSIVKILVGGFCTILLFWTGRSVQRAIESATAPGGWLDLELEVLPMSISFRLLALALWVVGLASIRARFAFDTADPDILTAAYWLVGMGLLAIILTRDPLKTTLGLLTFQNGFELLFSPLESGLFVLGLLGVANILTALVGAYLTIARNLSYLDPVPAPDSPEALSEAVSKLRERKAQQTQSGAEHVA